MATIAPGLLANFIPVVLCGCIKSHHSTIESPGLFSGSKDQVCRLMFNALLPGDWVYRELGRRADCNCHACFWFCHRLMLSGHRWRSRFDDGAQERWSNNRVHQLLRELGWGVGGSRRSGGVRDNTHSGKIGVLLWLQDDPRLCGSNILMNCGCAGASANTIPQ